VPLAAVRHFPAEHIECLGRLVEELGRRFHDKSSWVLLPGSQDARVDIGRCGGILGSQRILTVIHGSPGAWA
jgi:hypothetical protein